MEIKITEEAVNTALAFGGWAIVFYVALSILCGIIILMVFFWIFKKMSK